VKQTNQADDDEEEEGKNIRISKNSNEKKSFNERDLQAKKNIIFTLCVSSSSKQASKKTKTLKDLFFLFFSRVIFKLI